MPVILQRNLSDVDWAAMKQILVQDSFDNGRTPEQLRASFQNSFGACIAYDGRQIVGTARVLSDGVCNAYIVDVWTLSSHRHQGIATRMLGSLLQELGGQHVYLFTDDAAGFYQKLGFTERPVGMEKVVGIWLENG
jgi:predicted GNAT family acetyltransferase